MRLREFSNVNLERLLSEAENRKRQKTKFQDPHAVPGGVDDLFKPKAPADLTVPDKPQTPGSDSNDTQKPPQQDIRQRARQSDTLRASSNIATTDRMRELMSRMQNIEGDHDDAGYPDPEPPQSLPSVNVNTKNLPAVANQRLQAAGIQNPNFHMVANLPGNMSRAIRTMGRALFRSFTTTPTEDIWMIGNLNGQGPNSRQEVNAVAGWVRDSGERITAGDIDFAAVMPGYRADVQQWSAAGIRWLLVKDEFGDYIYSWPEQDSVTLGRTDLLSEAGEPKSPSRRGFLKAMGAAAATAAMPNQALGLAKTLTQPAVASAAAPASANVLNVLYQSVLDYGVELGYEIDSGYQDKGPEDLIDAIEAEIKNPGRRINNLIDVFNATIESDNSPNFKQARASIQKYIYLVTNATVDYYDDDKDEYQLGPTIRGMKDGDIQKHIRDYDLGDYLDHALSMLDEIIDNGESTDTDVNARNSKSQQPQGQEGVVPWDETYAFRTSPQGRPYLVTASQDGESTIVAYIKDGHPHIIDLEWDSTARTHGEVIRAENSQDENLIYDWTESNVDDNDLGSLVDTLIDGKISGQKQSRQPQPNYTGDVKNQRQQSGSIDSSLSSAANTLSDLDVIRKLSGLTGLSWLDRARDVVRDMVQKELKDLMSMSSGQDQPTADKPAAIPALPAPEQLQSDILSGLQSQMGRDLSDFEQTILKAEIQQELNKAKSQ